MENLKVLAELDKQAPEAYAKKLEEFFDGNSNFNSGIFQRVTVDSSTPDNTNDDYQAYALVSPKEGYTLAEAFKVSGGVSAIKTTYGNNIPSYFKPFADLNLNELPIAAPSASETKAVKENAENTAKIPNLQDKNDLLSAEAKSNSNFTWIAALLSLAGGVYLGRTFFVKSATTNSAERNALTESLDVLTRFAQAAEKEVVSNSNELVATLQTALQARDLQIVLRQTELTEAQQALNLAQKAAEGKAADSPERTALEVAIKKVKETQTTLDMLVKSLKPSLMEDFTILGNSGHYKPKSGFTPDTHKAPDGYEWFKKHKIDPESGAETPDTFDAIKLAINTPSR